jgi:vancomycin permeability regulator SanA
MKNYVVQAGVPSSDVFMDHAGFSTYESIYRARDVFMVKSAVIVTQTYHLYRALYVARRLGVDAVGVSADTQEYAGRQYRLAREFLARVKDFMMCVFKPEPTFLGDVVPVWGDGDATND